MNWKVALAPSVRDRIVRLGLPEQLEIYRRLYGELRADPDKVLEEVVVPFAHTRAYHFVLGVPPGRIFCMFAVRQLPHSDQLEVIGCRITEEAAMPN